MGKKYKVGKIKVLKIEYMHIGYIVSKTTGYMCT